MANILDIQAFIIRDTYTPPESFRSAVDFSQFINKTVDVSNYLEEGFTFDFIDGDNNGDLFDSDGNDETPYTKEDRIKYANPDGTTTIEYVQSLGFGDIIITYKDGSTYDSSTAGPVEGVRFFALRNGDLIINPRDEVRNDPNLLPQSQWETVTIIGPISNVLERTTVSKGDDPFPVCFTRGTLIETANGLVPVENLKKGDLIVTQDNDLQPIRWIGSQHVSGKALTKNPKLRPIRIRAGALGHCSPNVDLMVSPQHRILIRSKIAQRMFGTDEVLVAATHLQEIRGIDVANDASEVDYFHFMFDSHEIVFANGAASESLYAGPQALLSVGEKAREEIFTLFPELRDSDPDSSPAKARVFVPGRRST